VTRETIRRHDRAAAPLVSVVVLNHNYGRYLRQCIDSVLAQDAAPIEIIVVDDGSTDDSGAVIESYADRVTAVLKPNGGVISAMNRGFAESRGDVVIFLDADDYLLPGAVSAHRRALLEPGVVRSQIYLDVLSDVPWPGGRLPAQSAATGDLGDEVLDRGPGSYVSAPQSGNAWSRSFLSRVLPLPEELRGVGGDVLLMDPAPLFGKVALPASEALAVYRAHDSGMNSSRAAITLENLDRAAARFRARAELLARAATSLGHRPDPARWRRRNWRLLTVEHLTSRLSSARAAVPLTEHLRPALSASGAAPKRLMLALALFCVRVAPRALAVGLAGRLINLRYL